MAFSEFEIKRYEKAVAAFMQKRRPPPHLRDKVDMAYRFNNQSIEIYAIRPHWQDAHRKIEEPIAKTTYNKRNRNWKIFWQRADLKWHGYKPRLLVASIEEFLDVVDKDEYNCFFG